MSAAERPSRAQFAHSIRLDVRWGDMDSLGHVNNAKFFTFDEQARLVYFDAIGQLVEGFWKTQGLILARIGADFIQQVHYPAALDVCFRVAKLGRSSMETQGAVFQGDVLVAVTQGVVVWFDYVAQKPLAIPEAARVAIRQREVLAPLEA